MNSASGMKQMQGEKRADYIARVQAAQREDANARGIALRNAVLGRKAKRQGRRPASVRDRNADHIDGFDRDDIGPSED